jgi:hypothetical protein
MNDSEHTPLPWTTVGAARIWSTGTKGGAVAIIAEPRCENSSQFTEVELGSKRWSEAMANAEFIVRACNCHERLLEAARFCLSMAEIWVRDPDKSPNTMNVAFDALRAAIAKAVGRDEP